MIGWFALATLTLVAVVESVLSMKWHPLWFRSGLQLYCRSRSALDEATVESIQQLAEALPPTRYDRFEFEQIDTNIVAFSERGSWSPHRYRYTAVMHGILILDVVRNRVHVEGRMNWFPLVLTVLFIASPILSFLRDGTSLVALGPALVLVGLIAFIFRIQRKRYDEVLDVASKVSSW